MSASKRSFDTLYNLPSYYQRCNVAQTIKVPRYVDNLVAADAVEKLMSFQREIPTCKRNASRCNTGAWEFVIDNEGSHP